MQDANGATIVNLLIAGVGLMALIVLCMVGLMRRLGRVERSLVEWLKRNPARELSSLPEDSAASGLFESFLNEDPSRRNLPKSEQFAAFRQWRQEHGLNWSNS